MGAHPFLTLTLWIAMFERDHDQPLAMQLDYAAKLAHVSRCPTRHHHVSPASGDPTMTTPRQ